MPSNKDFSQAFDTISTMLNSGVPIDRVLQVTAQQAGSRSLQRALQKTHAMVEGGSNLTDALDAQECFPPLAINLVEVGEASGHTDQVFRELSQYYGSQHQMWRTFLSSLILPLLQYTAAIFVLALAQYVIGMFSGDGGSRGAVFTLLCGYGGPLLLLASYFLTTRVLRGSAVVHKLMLHVPLIRNVVQSLALARFSLVMHMMLESGISVMDAVQKGLEATGNKHFQAQSQKIQEKIEGGANLTTAFQATDLFPREYVEVVSAAEESGKTSDRFEWLAREHQKKARRYLSGLMAALSYAIWAVVAAFIIVTILSFASRYIQKINRLTGSVG